MVSAGRLRELGHPAAHIVAVGIELLALQDGIEDAEIGRGVGAAAGDPLPARGVVGGIGVDQRVPEPALADAPVDQQVLGQERRRDHAHAIVHPAGRPELAHAGVDDRIAGAAALPGLDGVVLVAREGVELRPEVALGEVAEVEEQVVGELAPAELGQELLGRGRQAAARGGAPDLARADLAESEVRRQPRRASKPAGRAPRGRSRAPHRGNREPSRAAASPGVQVARRPPAQSGAVGSKRHAASAIARRPARWRRQVARRGQRSHRATAGCGRRARRP